MVSGGEWWGVVVSGGEWWGVVGSGGESTCEAEVRLFELAIY